MAPPNTDLHWIVIGIMLVAGVCTTAFPIVYAFSPWRQSRVGRAMMYRSWGYAIVIDLMIVDEFFMPDRSWTLFIVELATFVFVAITSGYFLMQLIRTNYYNKEVRDE